MDSDVIFRIMRVLKPERAQRLVSLEVHDVSRATVVLSKRVPATTKNPAALIRRKSSILQSTRLPKTESCLTWLGGLCLSIGTVG